jgi:hypothetical protein
MTEKRDEGQVEGAEDVLPEGTDPVLLANALRFERAKNKVLLDEVIALEDTVVNRCMEDFDAVVSDETREFWREQLLTNRQPAVVALTEMQRAKQPQGGAGGRDEGADQRAEGGGQRADGGQRRPLHNRATARPVVPGAGGSPNQAGETDERAAKIRNRAQDISRLERVPFSTAFRRAEKECGSK